MERCHRRNVERMKFRWKKREISETFQQEEG
jgi:hypothetical protein